MKPLHLITLLSTWPERIRRLDVEEDRLSPYRQTSPFHRQSTADHFKAIMNCDRRYTVWLLVREAVHLAQPGRFFFYRASAWRGRYCFRISLSRFVCQIAVLFFIFKFIFSLSPFSDYHTGWSILTTPVCSLLFGRFHPVHTAFIWTMSFIILSLHVILGLPLFLFSAGIQCSACLARLAFSIRCTWPNHLSFFMYTQAMTDQSFSRHIRSLLCLSIVCSVFYWESYDANLQDASCLLLWPRFSTI